MKIKYIRDDAGTPYAADITLNRRELRAVQSRRVPMIYSPGGMGPEIVSDKPTVRFGGACYVDVSTKLRACLDAFRSAVYEVV